MRDGFFRGALVGTAVTALIGIIAAATAQQPAGQAARPVRLDGKPNFSGIWQVNNEANWDLEAHEARAGAVMQRGTYPYDFTQVPAAVSLPFGAAGGVPGSVGVVDGDGRIP